MGGAPSYYAAWGAWAARVFEGVLLRTRGGTDVNLGAVVETFPERLKIVAHNGVLGAQQSAFIFRRFVLRNGRAHALQKAVRFTFVVTET